MMYHALQSETGWRLLVQKLNNIAWLITWPLALASLGMYWPAVLMMVIVEPWVSPLLLIIFWGIAVGIYDEEVKLTPPFIFSLPNRPYRKRNRKPEVPLVGE